MPKKITCPHCEKQFNATISRGVPLNTKKMREIRERRGLFRRHIGAAIGYSESAITAWELGHHQPDMEAVKNIAEVLEVDYKILLLKEL